MQIISHRGFWLSQQEKNTQAAFKRSFEQGFGTETDVRDLAGQLMIAHDCPRSDDLQFSDFLGLYCSYPSHHDLPLAINIKADGLQVLLKEALSEHNIKNYFVFDMSIPDTLGYINQNISFFTRHSEYEPRPAFYREANGVWLDCFQSIWYNKEEIIYHINCDKYIALVSPELHGREPFELWEILKAEEFYRSDLLFLCTDLPNKARDFFYG